MNKIPFGRKVSGLLGVGIFFMPYIFSWVTLKDGYSKNARIASFVWMTVVLVFTVHRYNPHAVVRSEPSAQPPVSNFRSTNQKMSASQLNGMCEKGGMYALAYMHLKNSGQDFSNLQPNMDGDLKVYPENLRPNFKLIWMKMFSIVDSARDPRMYGTDDQQKSASFALVSGCQTAMKRQGLVN